jgi:hypothetical protein
LNSNAGCTPLPHLFPRYHSALDHAHYLSIFLPQACALPEPSRATRTGSRRPYRLSHLTGISARPSPSRLLRLSARTHRPSRTDARPADDLAVTATRHRDLRRTIISTRVNIALRVASAVREHRHCECDTTGETQQSLIAIRRRAPQTDRPPSPPSGSPPDTAAPPALPHATHLSAPRRVLDARSEWR